MKKALILIALIGFVYACSDKETTPQTNDSANQTLCDTVQVTYDDQIGNILNGSCFPCHTSSSNAGINVSTYAGAKSAAQNSKFLTAIKHESGAQAMPQGGAKLGDQTIEYIECWINSGFPEN